MSGVSRRGLFSLLTGNQKKADKPAASGFSLSDFYAKRNVDDPIPHFRVHGADVPMNSTNIGLGEPEAVGVIRIFPEACLAYTSFCSVCSERCPVAGAIVIEAGRPRIVESACTGCGDCLRACPAPKTAMRFVKREAP